MYFCPILSSFLGCSLHPSVLLLLSHPLNSTEALTHLPSFGFAPFPIRTQDGFLSPLHHIHQFFPLPRHWSKTYLWMLWSIMILYLDLLLWLPSSLPGLHSLHQHTCPPPLLLCWTLEGRLDPSHSCRRYSGPVWACNSMCILSAAIHIIYI